MQMKVPPKYSFDLPPEENVIKRNRTITTYYAQLYQKEPQLYKWAGMAAFASYHVGEKMKMWNWDGSGIKPLSVTCNKKNRSLEDDFQIIRIINNKIFLEIGRLHLVFSQLDFPSFRSLLIREHKHDLIIRAFEELNEARVQLRRDGYSEAVNELVWKANTDLLWHEQSEVVQPLFDRLSDLFSQAMTLFATLDYKTNHQPTSRDTRSVFILYMLFNGLSSIRRKWLVPKVTNLEHRWCWISNSLLKKWRIVESDQDKVVKEMGFLTRMEDRNLVL